MRWYNMFARILLFLTVITFALAAPVQEEHKAPEDMITALGKRVLDEDLNALWEVLWHRKNALGKPAPPKSEPPGDVQMAEVHLPPPNGPNSAGVRLPEGHGPLPDLGNVQMAEVHVPPQRPAYSDRELMESGDDEPPASPNAPRADPQSENLTAADSNLEGKAKVSRRISGTASGVDMMDAARIELPSAADSGP